MVTKKKKETITTKKFHRKLYEGQKIPTYQLSIMIGLSKNALSDYANRKKDIDSMSVGTLKKLAKIEGINPEKLYKKIKDYSENNIEKITK